MKKVFLILILFIFVASPSFALRMIVNTVEDRTVPSRCTTPDNYIEEDNSYVEIENKKNSYNASRFDARHKDYLGENIRRELIGTTWDYSTPQKVETMPKVPKINVKNTPKRFLREAADYYTVDTLKTPKRAVPAGFNMK
jgi:hypothetical protein